MYNRILLFLIAGIAGAIIANKKGRSLVIWGLSCFVFPPLILIITMLPPKLARGKTRICPQCSKIVYREDTVCRYCRKELPIELVQCTSCGSFVPDSAYCVNCKRKLRG